MELVKQTFYVNTFFFVVVVMLLIMKMAAVVVSIVYINWIQWWDWWIMFETSVGLEINFEIELENEEIRLVEINDFQTLTSSLSLSL